MTKVMIGGLGWLYLVGGADWYSKEKIRHFTRLQARCG
jgi:hypothetical protein